MKPTKENIQWLLDTTRFPDEPPVPEGWLSMDDRADYEGALRFAEMLGPAFVEALRREFEFRVISEGSLTNTPSRFDCLTCAESPSLPDSN